MPKTRLGLYGGARAPYGSFAGKTEEVGGGITLLNFLRGYARGFSVGLYRGFS
jgi:hypothetical protein